MLLFFLLLLYLCVFAAILYALEYDAQKDCAQCSDDGFGCSCPSKLGFTSIPTTWYFIIASMTTVGCKSVESSYCAPACLAGSR